MSEFTTIEEAREDLLACAVYLAGNINSHEAQAEAIKPIVRRYLEKGDVDNAAHFSDVVNDSFFRNQLMVAVIEKCVELNDDEYAFQLVEAIDDYGLQATARETIAEQEAIRGDFEKATEIAENLEHSSNAFATIAVNQAKKGLEPEALQTLTKIEYDKAIVGALETIATHFLEQKQPEKALDYLEKAFEEAESIEFAEDRISSLLEIGNLFIAVERNDKAIETFAKATREIEKLDGVHVDVLYANAAIGYLNAGSIDFADRTLDEVHDKVQMANCLLGFSQVFLRDNENEESLDALEESYAILKSQEETEIRDTKARNQMFSNIAIQFARLEKIERAVEIAHENEDESLTTLALTNIAQLCILQGKDDLADETLKGIEADNKKLTALIAMSDAQNQAENKSKAVELLNEAEALVGYIPQFIARAETQNELAKRYAFYGKNEKSRELASQSLQTIGNILGDNNRSIALTELSTIFEKNEFVLNDEDKEVLATIIKKSDF